MTIAAALIEPLSRKIARIFTLAELNLILLKTSGERLYDLVPRDKPDPATVSELVDRISARSMELAVLGEMLAQRPDDAEFAALVAEAAPGAQNVPRSTEANVSSLVQGLDAVRAKLEDPAVKGALTSSKTELLLISSTIDSLDAYKALHECLHQLQAKQFATLREAARNLGGDPAQAAELRVFRNQLRNACLFANQAVLKLPDTPVVRRTELLWIGELEAAGDEFHDAIQARDPDAARRALNRIARIMRNTPPRLNTQIFAMATELPLEKLAGALQDVIVPVVGGPTQGALQALRLIIPAIRARVVEHKDWQDADNVIADLDRLVELGSPRLIEEFAADWLELKAKVLELAARDAGAEWAEDLQGYVRDVDDRLAAEVADARFLDAFAVFRGDAQYHFLIVDSRLKADCSELVKIGEPLNRILSELGA
ncbi:hypothetical protein GI374_12165 [Paracoccus sp. S-4012]|uniref:hypothetical protein n=1 Tax=Paracoccus sp. S-4012 TaxID=2665648 RepID=UPI0012AFA414|nr:hypothetical protein [Paracoccus sp. S-4012]MRX51190.1 hypothetical protein [Paracoccus sp. S-4012]